MASIFGNKIKVSVFGQSHSAAIGVNVDGLPVGIHVDMERLKQFMDRRAPGRDRFSTQRKEADAPEFLAGLVDFVTCGAPLTAIIRNTNMRSGDYANLRDIPRPGHADYTAQVKYHGFQDVAGGGHFSGRLTAPLCIAGGICLQYLETLGVKVSAHIARIADVCDTPIDPMIDDASKAYVGDKAFPVLSDAAGEKMQQAIDAARMDCDSVGGVIECVITGLPVGLGDPMFDGVENRLAAALFGIPAVKGLEFGEGFAAAGLRGSQNNDAYTMQDGRVVTKTNHAGGILGGITNGMPVIFRLAIKPTPSIAKEQESVSFSEQKDEKLSIVGRHDPCIVPRAVAVVEAVAAIVAADMISESRAAT